MHFIAAHPLSALGSSNYDQDNKCCKSQLSMERQFRKFGTKRFGPGDVCLAKDIGRPLKSIVMYSLRY